MQLSKSITISNKWSLPSVKGLSQGVLLSFVVAFIGIMLSKLPYFAYLGPMVIAILLGILWKTGISIPAAAEPGISFSAKKLLRAGIVLLGMRLNLSDIAHAGSRVVGLAAVNLVFALLVVYGIARLYKVESKVAFLMAIGTAICGAAAIAAVSPILKAKDEEVAIGVVVVAVLGTCFTIGYTILFPVLGLNPIGFGMFSGSTLHEIAHVIAAAEPLGPDALNMAIIVKLTRVAMLLPVCFIIGVVLQAQERRNQGKSSYQSLPVPWFILGFLAVSGLNSMGWIPEFLVSKIVFAAYFLLTMAMAGLGLGLNTSTLRGRGVRAIGSAFLGSVLLSLLGWFLVLATQ